MSEMDELFEMFFTMEPDAVEYMTLPLSGEGEYIQLD
jgi:hypothetical protein